MSAILALRPSPHVETVRLGNGTWRARAGQRRRHWRRSIEARFADQPVDSTRLATERLEHRAGVSPRLRPRRGDGNDAERFEHVLRRVSGVAPRLQERVRPRRGAEVISPGTAKTSRPASSAKSAVIRRAAALARLDDDRGRRRARR